MGKPNFAKRERRYERDAEAQTIHPETKARWQRRWILFGPRSMPVLTCIRGMAHLHSAMQRRLNRAEGEKRHAEGQVAKLLRNEQKTQGYIKALKYRLAIAASEKLTVAEFLEQEHARVREYKAKRAGA